MPDIICLHARAGAARYPGSEERVLALLDQQFPAVSRELVVCDTEAGPEVRAEPWRVLPVSSVDREFGAWHAAAGHLGLQLRDTLGTVMSTAAFDKQYAAYLPLFTGDWCSHLDEPTAIGHVDYFDAPVLIDGIASQSWLRTSYVLLSGYLAPEALEATLPLPDDDELFTEDPTAPLAGDFISDNFKQYVIGWLTGDGTGQGVRWHSSAMLTEEGLPEFRSKVRSLLREHLLTVRLRQRGATVWDATYVSGCNTPDRRIGWRQQLAARPRDAAVVPAVPLHTAASRRRHPAISGAPHVLLPAEPGDPSLGDEVRGASTPHVNSGRSLSTLHRRYAGAGLATFRVDSPYLSKSDHRTPLVLAVTTGGLQLRGNWLDLMVNALCLGDDVHMAHLRQEGAVVEGLVLMSAQLAGEVDEGASDPAASLAAAWELLLERGQAARVVAVPPPLPARVGTPQGSAT